MLLDAQRFRILYISFIPPTPTWGGAMAFYRHFIDRTDFEVEVATSCDPLPRAGLPYQYTAFRPSWFTRRVLRTRLLPWAYGIHSLVAAGRTPRSVWQAARAFRPDAVFTIAGSWDYSALVAQQVARRLGVPLIASFNDWFDYGWFPSHRIFHGLIERRFRRFYREADLALCTSEGMLEALGPHPDAHILYPIGATCAEETNDFQIQELKEGPRVVGFAGNLGDWYGPMVEALVGEVRSRGYPLEFRLFGSNPQWSPAFAAWARETGAYRGQVPFEQLRREMEDVDVLLLPMGFGHECAQIERTSFKTKFLDYLAYRKPIFVWGPEYCSAVRVAREFNSAAICTTADSAHAAEELEMLSRDPVRQCALMANAQAMYADRFHPDRIHAELVEAVNRAIGGSRR